MKTQITQLLSELYQLDPELQKQEPQLIRILEKMTANKPDTHFDEAFRSELKTKLLSEIAHSKTTDRGINWRAVFAGFLAGGSAISFAAYAIIQSLTPMATVAPETNTSTVGTLAVNTIDFGFKKSEKGDAAFGTLATAGASQEAKGGGGTRMMAPERTNVSAVPPNAAPSPVVAPVAPVATMAPAATSAAPVAGTAATDAATAAPGAGMASKMMATENARIMMPPFEQKVYKYVYSGSGFTVKDAQMSVLQKKKNSMTADEAQGFLKNFKISSIDIGHFSALKLNSMSLLEDREYGLGLNLDFMEGTLSISKNWAKWPQESCQNGVCPTAKLEEVTPDEKALEIANKFFKDYKINLSSYGTPYVNNDWKKEYEKAADKSTAWVPNAVSIVYPLVIEGKTVYEEYGQPKGINVSIDVKTGLVTDVYGMEKLDFDSSNYATETDTAKILEVAQNGGRSWNYGPIGLAQPEKVTTVDVRLGEPEMTYVHLSDYQDGTSKDYLVPALVFPVLDQPKEGEYFQDKVIVPVIREFFTRKNSPIMYMKESR